MLYRFVLVMLLLALNSFYAVSAHSVIGLGVDEAKHHDFFTFFHFEEAGRETEPNDQTEVAFKTGIANYVVQLGVTLNKQQHITGMVLVMPREFIDDPKLGMNASDIARSFISAAVPASDNSSVKDLCNEIAFRERTWTSTNVSEAHSSSGEVQKGVTVSKPDKSPLKKGDTVWLGNGPVPKLPENKSSGYLTYAGRQKRVS